MRRKRIAMTALAMVLAVSASAETRTSFNLSISNAPPPPVVVVREEPSLLLVPGSTVYVVNDRRVGYDSFRYGTYWYVYNDGYWYRARGYRGPFGVIETRYVPAAIIRVPAKHWKHHPHGGPPGQMKKGRSGGVVVVKEGPYGGKHGH